MQDFESGNAWRQFSVLARRKDKVKLVDPEPPLVPGNGNRKWVEKLRIDGSDSEVVGVFNSIKSAADDCGALMGYSKKAREKDSPFYKWFRTDVLSESGGEAGDFYWQLRTDEIVLVPKVYVRQDGTYDASEAIQWRDDSIQELYDNDLVYLEKEVYVKCLENAELGVIEKHTIKRAPSGFHWSNGSGWACTVSVVDDRDDVDPREKYDSNEYKKGYPKWGGSIFKLDYIDLLGEKSPKYLCDGDLQLLHLSHDQRDINRDNLSMGTRSANRGQCGCFVEGCQHHRGTLDGKACVRTGPDAFGIPIYNIFDVRYHMEYPGEENITADTMEKLEKIWEKFINSPNYYNHYLN